MQISVVIPLYNKKDSIERALQSVIGQTVQPHEIIVVNDGSTDGSEEIVARLNHPLVKLVNQRNAGVSSARNRGIEEAKNEWIAFIDADDLWNSFFIETIFLLHKTYPQAAVLATAYELQDYLGGKRSIVLNKISFEGEHGLLDNYFEVASCSNPPICSSAVTIKKDALNCIENFPVNIKSGEDLITWARLAINYKIAYSLKPMSVFIKSKPDDNDSRLLNFNFPDYVRVNLENLISSSSEIKIKNQIAGYIGRWIEMRIMNLLMYTKWKRRILKEIKLYLKYKPYNIKILMLFILTFLPKKIRVKIITYIKKLTDEYRNKNYK